MKFISAYLALYLLLIAPHLHAQVKHVSRHSSSGSSLARGKVVYTKICLSCHMANGGGVPMMNPPLINTSYVLGDKTKLIKIVLNGFNEDVEINGQTYSNAMTPHNDLKDQQIADVLTYVRKSFGNKASSVTAAEVKKVRATNIAK
ncbi:c-type cytochrome [Mucilaginibacter sp.]|uniref:c-type cytochrome n=1 Tax=Mucilaginibacter sp. TaxID=1882438 RepID=UPI003D141013